MLAYSSTLESLYLEQRQLENVDQPQMKNEVSDDILGVMVKSQRG